MICSLSLCRRRGRTAERVDIVEDSEAVDEANEEFTRRIMSHIHGESITISLRQGPAMTSMQKSGISKGVD